MVEMASDRLESPGIDAHTLGRGAAQAEGEARDALLALGYKPREVSAMLAECGAPGMSSEDLIREALKRVHSI